MKTATGLVLWWLKLWGFYGWTSAFGTIYALPGYENNPLLRKHEETHVMQQERDGRIWFHLKYAFYLLRYGYKNNPYELEARQLSGT
jgi:hypothetical protein